MSWSPLLRSRPRQASPRTLLALSLWVLFSLGVDAADLQAQRPWSFSTFPPLYRQSRCPPPCVQASPLKPPASWRGHTVAGNSLRIYQERGSGCVNHSSQVNFRKIEDIFFSKFIKNEFPSFMHGYSEETPSLKPQLLLCEEISFLKEK